MSVPAPATAGMRLAALLAEARTRARTSRRPVLVSLVDPAPSVDPLEALDALAAARVGHESIGAGADRMYWTRPADEFSLAGFGAVVSLRHRGPDRFAIIDREWSALLEGALVEDPSDGARGVGPTLMGGFAFEPDGPRSDRWRDFPAARLILPRIQLTVSAGASWVTLNVLVDADGEPDLPPVSLLSLRKAVDSARAGRRSPAGRPPLRVMLESAGAQSVAAWRASVNAAVAAIRADALEKVVLAREVRITAPRDFVVAAALRELRSAHQASYVFGCWHGASAFVGASPELLVGLDGREVHASSLAGSVARGSTDADDAALAADLLHSAKDRVEHEVVRRALCDGLSQLCDDVVADVEPSLLSLPQVHHLYTDVRARLRDDHSLLELLARLHPTPAVGGEPREAALGFIREHEGMDRGWYAAPVGWLQRERGEFAVALRSALVRRNEAVLFAGCGIVADSDPDAEYAESLLKLRPMEIALAGSIAADDAAAPKRAAAGGGTIR
jgi:isochorismate synthase